MGQFREFNNKRKNQAFKGQELGNSGDLSNRTETEKLKKFSWNTFFQKKKIIFYSVSASVFENSDSRKSI